MIFNLFPWLIGLEHKSQIMERPMFMPFSYMKGFIILDQETKACKLSKAFYGL
jgi:hypothetical protein